MISVATNENVLNLWLGNKDIEGLPVNKNYYKGTPSDIKLAAENTENLAYRPIGQGSVISNADSGKRYVYLVDSNSNALRGQTGHWCLVK